MTGATRAELWARWTLAAIALAGLGIAVYLTVERARGHAPSCILGGGCATVQASRYSELAGIPVAWLGIAGYVGMLVAAALPGVPGAFAGLFVTTISVGFSAWLTYVELAVIDAICAWCVGSAVLTVLAFGCSLFRLAVVSMGNR